MSSTSATYTYNGDGLRISKTISGTTGAHVWDVAEGMPLMIMDGGNYYVTGAGGLPIEWVKPDGTTTFYYHSDQQGSTRALTDSSGTQVQSYTFDPYGNLQSSTGSLTQPFQYDGQYLDSETGFYYLRAPYYDPFTFNFTTVDPLVQQTWQGYQYSGNSPLTWGDPTGLLDVAAGWSALIHSAHDQGPMRAQDLSESAHNVSVMCIGLELVPGGELLATACTLEAVAIATGADAWMAWHGDPEANWGDVALDVISLGLGAVDLQGVVGVRASGGTCAQASTRLADRIRTQGPRNTPGMAKLRAAQASAASRYEDAQLGSEIARSINRLPLFFEVRRHEGWS